MSLAVLHSFVLNHGILGNIIVFVMMAIANIFPMMFFGLPDIIIFLGIFIAKKVTIWYIPYIGLIVGAFIGEFISYLIGYKYGYKILEHKFLKKDITQKWIQKMKKNPIKILIIGKITPGVTRFIAILSGSLKTDSIKFAIVNLIMIIYSISRMFFVRIIGIGFLENYLGEYVWYIVFIILILYILYHIYNMKKNNGIKE